MTSSSSGSNAATLWWPSRSTVWTVSAKQAASVARTVLLATPLPNHRDRRPGGRSRPRIRAAHADALPLGERFATADWERLLSDEVHPNEEGYELLARIVAEELERRGLIATHAS